MHNSTSHGEPTSMEIEPELAFSEDLDELFEEKIFKRTLILWFHYKKKLNGNQISNETHYPRQTVYDTIKKWEQKGTVEDLFREGRPIETTEEEKEIIIEKQKNDRFKYVKDIFRENKEEGLEASYGQTLRTIDAEFHRDPVPFKLKINPENKRKRVKWIVDHDKWRKSKWSRVIWTDEKVFELHPQKGKLYTKLLEGETVEDFARPKVQQGGKKVMVWGAISSLGKIYIDFIEENFDAYKYCCFLCQKAIPAIRSKCNKSYIFMQDNAPAHRACLTRAYLEISGIEVLDWSAQSPDLNPIEEVWLWMQTRIKTRVFNNVNELKDGILETWEKIPKTAIVSFIEKLESKKNIYFSAFRRRISGPLG